MFKNGAEYILKFKIYSSSSENEPRISKDIAQNNQSMDAEVKFIKLTGNLNLLEINYFRSNILKIF